MIRLLLIVPAYMGIDTSASVSLEWDSQSVVELLRAPKHRGRVFRQAPIRQKLLIACPWSLVPIDLQVDHECRLLTSLLFSI